MWDVSQVVMGSQLLAFLALRLAYEPSKQATTAVYESGIFRWVMSVVALGQVSILVILVFKPELVSFAAVPIPTAFRWAGAGLGVLTLGFLAWTYRILGTNYHSLLHLDKHQRHVTSGP